MNTNSIKIYRARENNLKEISLEIPLNKIVVMTGPSGSGKSTLAELIYNESLKRFYELTLLHKNELTFQLDEKVDSIEDIITTIYLPQISSNLRSKTTIGNYTGIYQLLVNLFLLESKYRCECGYISQKFSELDIINILKRIESGVKLWIVSPVEQSFIKTKKIKELISKGINRIVVNNEIKEISSISPKLLDTHKEIKFIIDRITLHELDKKINRIKESIKLAKVVNESTVELWINENNIQKIRIGDKCPKCGKYIPPLSKEIFNFLSPLSQCNSCRGRGVLINNKGEDLICYSCNGYRLKRENLGYILFNKNIGDLCTISTYELYNWIMDIEPNLEFTASIFNKIKSTILEKLSIFTKLGIQYLSLFKDINKLSTGEWNKIRLLTLFIRDIKGVLYIFDEPTSGMTDEEIDLVINYIKKISSNCSIMIIEHNPRIIQIADYIIELGPGGKEGGKILYCGGSNDYIKSKGLDKPINISSLIFTKPDNLQEELEIKNIHVNNLKIESLRIPINKLSIITGKSGTGKSTLLNYIYNYVTYFQKETKIKKVYKITQSPISNNPYITVASYLGIFDEIKELFVLLPEAKKRGYKPKNFSLKDKDSLCEICNGNGYIKSDIPFETDLIIRCPGCNGNRFKQEILEVKFNGYSIGELLELSVDKAVDLFKNIPSIIYKLNILFELKLEYLTLGQIAHSLSGGEMERLKLAKILLKGNRTTNNLLLIDEPTKGLSVKESIHLFQKLKEISKKNTVIVIEYHDYFFSFADYLIELDFIDNTKSSCSSIKKIGYLRINELGV